MGEHIESHLREDRIIPPPAAFQQSAIFSSKAQYLNWYNESVNNPEKFWAERARESLHWFKDFKQVYSFEPDTIGKKLGSYVRWFDGGELNVSFNCLDKHQNTPRFKAPAYIWQGEKKKEKRVVTYEELLDKVKIFAAVLRKYGVKKGSTVTIYMPMIPELPIAMLACARLGAIHSVVFSAFSSDSLRNRINDNSSSVVITSDVAYHAGKTNLLKAHVDEALHHCPTVKSVIVWDRSGQGLTNVQMLSGRDVSWKDEMEKPDVQSGAEPVSVDSEHPLFMLYTSGSTGKPKGVLHTSAGYLLYTSLTFKFVFDYRDSDIFWCTADIGWITGHSYVVYGPLSNGATVMMFEGVPTYPQPDRFWEVAAEHKVSVFYTAPTAIRSLMRFGDAYPAAHDLSSIRLLGSVGEPINPEAWIWYWKTVGGERCPVVDTWWQTETGGVMITTLPGVHQMKPGSAGLPFFGVRPKVVKDNGAPAEPNEGGSLVIEGTWPSMIRGVYGDEKNELIEKVYFSAFRGKYFTGDGCRIDEEGYYWLLGRIDDVVNVSAHRFSTAEIESALVSHPAVAEAAVVPCPHDIKGQGIYCFVTLKDGRAPTDELSHELIKHVRDEISPIATPERIHFAPGLPKTRSGKIMRRILRKIAEGEVNSIGDTSTLADPSVIEHLLKTR